MKSLQCKKADSQFGFQSTLRCCCCCSCCICNWHLYQLMDNTTYWAGRFIHHSESSITTMNIFFSTLFFHVWVFWLNPTVFILNRCYKHVNDFTFPSLMFCKETVWKKCMYKFTYLHDRGHIFQPISFTYYDIVS